MKFSKRRDLRQKLAMAMGTMCTNGPFDNKGLIKKYFVKTIYISIA